MLMEATGSHSQFCFYILNSEICSALQVPVCVYVCDYLRFFRKDAGSLASSVLTRPNSCMTLSSCLRSSWPFSRNMNSWPLLPAEGAAINNIYTPRTKTEGRYVRIIKMTSFGRAGCLFRGAPPLLCSCISIPSEKVSREFAEAANVFFRRTFSVLQWFVSPLSLT